METNNKIDIVSRLFILDIYIYIYITLSPIILFEYLLKLPLGDEWWIVSLNDLEDIIGGYVWLG